MSAGPVTRAGCERHGQAFGIQARWLYGSESELLGRLRPAAIIMIMTMIRTR